MLFFKIITGVDILVSVSCPISAYVFVLNSDSIIGNQEEGIKGYANLRLFHYAVWCLYFSRVRKE
jgi:hypothetical protein